MRNLIALLALASACYKDNPNFDGGDLVPDSDDMTGPACETSEDCMGGTPVCDDGQCVQCTAADQDACAPSLVCGSDNQCRNCVSHAECTLSQACLASGQCAEADDVAYVAPDGTGADCTRDEPCGTLTEAVDQGRPVIKLAAGRTDGTETVRLTNRAIEVVAEVGAEIESGTESVIRLDGQAAKAIVSDVTVIGMQTPISLNGAFSVSDVGGALALHRVTVYHHQGPAIRVARGDLIMDRCNLVENTGGGIAVSDARFTITNSIVVNNGASTTSFGGVQITRPMGSSKFAFNTIASNVSNTSSRSGLDCASSFEVTSSIVHNNNNATCEATYTLFDGVPSPGGTNLEGLANFIEVNPVNYDEPTFYRIAENSAASNVAMPDDDVTIDIDGDPRSLTPDMGADER